MAEENKKSKASSIGLALAGLILLGAVIVYAWNKTPNTPDNRKNNNNNNQQTQNQTPATQDNSEAGKLGPNEVSVTAANFDETIKANKIMVIDAYAPWCPHCQKVSPILTELSNDYVGKVKFGKMNSDNQDQAQKANFDFAVNNGLKGYPTVWIYKDGNKVKEMSGEYTKEEYKAEIDKALQ